MNSSSNQPSNSASKSTAKIPVFERRTQKEREAQERRNKTGMKKYEGSCSFVCNDSWNPYSCSLMFERTRTNISVCSIRVRVRSSLEWGTYLSKVYRSSKRTLPTTSGWMSYWARNGIYWENLNTIMMMSDLRCWWQNHYVGYFFVLLVSFSMY